MTYDFLLKGGHVIDPGNNVDGVRDVAISSGKVAAVDEAIPEDQAKRSVDVSGLYVTPGLVDIHTHMYATPGHRKAWAGDNSILPDGFSFRAGVTTMVDTGSAGPRTFEDFRYRGEPSDLAVSIALANSGPLQIELIQQRNDAPSMYRDFLAAGHEGLQHVAYWTRDFDADLARLEAEGFRVGQSGCIGASGRFVYFETQAHPGTVVELSEISGPKGRFFQHIADAAACWDGSEPIRPLGG